jgi:hypothetical protein
MVQMIRATAVPAILSAGKEGDHNTETMNARDAKLHRSKQVTVG